jgi:hypothetical protein
MTNAVKVNHPAIVAVFVLGVVTASSAASAPHIDACSMLTQVQVSTVLGVDVQAGQHIVPSATNLCGWAPPGGPSINGKKVVLDFKTTQAFEIGKTPIKGMTKTPVSGIGDDAYHATAQGLGTNLSVRKGDVAFNIALHGDFPIEQIKDKEKDLALKILSRL